MTLEEVKACRVKMGSEHVKHREKHERSLRRGECRARWGQRGEAGFTAQRVGS